MEQPFFAAIDWNDLKRKRIIPPFKPEVRRNPSFYLLILIVLFFSWGMSWTLDTWILNSPMTTFPWLHPPHVASVLVRVIIIIIRIILTILTPISASRSFLTATPDPWKALAVFCQEARDLWRSLCKENTPGTLETSEWIFEERRIDNPMAVTPNVT